MNTIEKEVLSFLKESKLINPSEELLVTLKPFNTDGGVTNKYYLIEIENKSKYLYRCPGKQWNGSFSRLTEEFNLKIVYEMGIQTGVLYFNSISGKQILTYKPKQKSLDKKIGKSEIVSIAKIFNKLHGFKKLMQNDYNPVEVIWSSYKRLPNKENHVLKIEKNLIERILFDWLCSFRKIVPCHNEPYLSNFIKNRKNFRFVDWEYSANNFKEWDLAFFSLKAMLNPFEEEFFIMSYYSETDENINHNIVLFNLFKPIVAMVLLIWSASRLPYLKEEAYQQQIKKLNHSKEQYHHSLIRLFSYISPLKTHLSPKKMRVSEEGDTKLVCLSPKP